MAPTFSIIIPVYNVAPYLAECLDSVCAQTYPDWEALCVDDGSSDTSSTRLDTYARLDPRIHVTHQRNAGVSSARNRALNTARGEWIWFVDGDDAIHPQALLRLAGVIQTTRRRPQAISFEILNADQRPGWGVLPEVGGYREVDECTESIFWRFRAGVWRTLLARELIKGLRFEPFCMGEDMLFSLASFARMTHWTLLDEALYFYRERQGSACHSPVRQETVRDWLSVQARLMDVLLASRRLFVLGGGIAERYLPWWGGQLYYTSGEMLFHLPIPEMRAYYGRWMDNLTRFCTYWPWPIRKRFSIAILRRYQSPLLARALIYWPLQIRRRIWRA